MSPLIFARLCPIETQLLLRTFLQLFHSRYLRKSRRDKLRFTCCALSLIFICSCPRSHLTFRSLNSFILILILQLTYFKDPEENDKNFSRDRSKLIPTQALYYPQTTCSRATKSQSVSSQADYEESLQTDCSVAAGGDFMGVSEGGFSFSTGLKNFRREVSNCKILIIYRIIQSKVGATKFLKLSPALALSWDISC